STARAGLRGAQLLPIGELLGADSPRESSHNPDHVRMLAAKETELPPILVHWPSLRVIDGMHRTKAAILQGQTHINARLFEGQPEEAFVLAVEANVKDGLPLTL